MTLFLKARSFLRNLFSSHRLEADLEEEVRSHLELLTAENVRAGMAPNQAQRAARIELGGVEQLKEEVREERLGNWLHSVCSDCCFALRQLRKSPAFTVVAVFTLALGIGANTAIFSFSDLLLNHPVSVRHLNRLVAVGQVRADGEEAPLSPANFRELRARASSLESFADYQEWTASLDGNNGAEESSGVRVGEDFFATLEAEPFLGRVFIPEEQQPGKNRVVVISYAFWQREFAGHPKVTEKSLRLDGENYSILGVMPPDFQFPPGGSQFWVPLALDAAQSADGNQRTLSAVGRLKPAASVPQSRAELNTLWTRLQRRYPEANRRWELSIVPLRNRLVEEDSRQFAVLFLCVAGFVLLIACVNVANLQLTRASSRGRELSIRAAVGADRARIVRQLFTESLVLAAVGGTAGLLLAYWGVALLRVNMPAQVREICDVSGMRLDFRAFLFTLSAATASGILSGATPAFCSSKVNLRDSLESGGARMSGGGHPRLRGIFVISEVILSVVLLVGAGLMVKGFYLLATRQTAMEPQTLLTFHLNLSPVRYATPQQRQIFCTLLLDRLRGVPGVNGVSAVSGLPYSFYENDQKAVSDGVRGESVTDLPTVMQESVSDSYFRVLRLAFLEGRSFDPRDRAGSTPVAIIGESMARRFWPGVQAVGHRLQLPESNSPDWVTVVGVVTDIRHEVYDRNFRSILYRPLAQLPQSSMDIALRTDADPHRLTATVRSIVADLDSAQPISLLLAMDEKINRQASALQFVATLMALFGLVATLLSTAGIYGLITFSVIERRREIGIRMALGARPKQILSIVVRLAVSFVAIGGVTGLVSGFVLAQFLSRLIYGVQAWDPTVYATVSLLLLIVTLMATFLPALRATRVDPIIALRYE
jgi:putative ABC transport system permease protein